MAPGVDSVVVTFEDQSIHSTRSNIASGETAQSNPSTPGPKTKPRMAPHSPGVHKGGAAEPAGGTPQHPRITVVVEEDPHQPTVHVAEDEPDIPVDRRLACAPVLHGDTRVHQYFRKWKAGIDKRLPIPRVPDLFWSWLGALLGIMAISAIDAALTSQHEGLWLAASFGASAVLVYGVPESKLAQPRNVIGGHVVSAVVGVIVRLIFNSHLNWLANGLAMSLALLFMQLTQTTHPPGGATALIATTAPTLPWYGFQLVPAVALGSVIMVVIGLVVNNIPRDRAYPTYWW